MEVRSLHFGRFELQPRERRLLVDGTPTLLGPRAFDVLLQLVARPGQLVTKAELLDRVWAGLVVVEANLTVQVSNLRKVLGGELIETVPGFGYRFNGRPVVVAPASASPAPAQTQPDAPAPAPPTPQEAAALLFGREHDLRQLQAALAPPGLRQPQAGLEQPVLVSLVGPAGVGKTALARAYVERADSAAGAAAPVWVDLAALSEDAQVTPALARALGQHLPPADAMLTLAAALQGGRLLVLDNAEHLRAATAALLTELLPHAGGLRVLVTSQVPLGLPGEQVRPLEPLRVAGADEPAEQALQSDAIGLLVARARSADGRLRFGSGQLPVLRSLCRQLDGLPLALEMAAARVPLLGLEGVHEALAERFALLRRRQRGVASRHQTLHAALAWSHSLLAPQEQALFRQLGVFAGGFPLELILTVAGGDGADRWALIDSLATLVDYSLVVTVPGDAGQPPRYRLLETMHAFAVERLRESGEEQSVAARHAAAVQAFLKRRRAAKELCVGAEHDREMAQGLAELENARKAWQWALRHDLACAVGISAAAASLTPSSPWRMEVFAWMTACEPLLDDRVPLAEQALWWTEYAHLMLPLRLKRAAAVARRACELARASGDEMLQAWSLNFLARSYVTPDTEARRALEALQALLERHPEWPERLRLHAVGTRALVAYHAQDLPAALGAFEEEMLIAEGLQLRDAAGVAESNMIACLMHLGRREEAVAATRRALQRTGDRHTLATTFMRCNMLGALVSLGRAEEAAAEVPLVWRLAREFDTVVAVAEAFARLALLQGRPKAAALLHGHWLGLCEQRNAVPELDGESADTVARIRAALGGGPASPFDLAPRVMADEAVERLLLGRDDVA